jgi:hypothetical protein
LIDEDVLADLRELNMGAHEHPGPVNLLPIGNAQGLLGVIRVAAGQGNPSVRFRNAPKADAESEHGICREVPLADWTIAEPSLCLAGNSEAAAPVGERPVRPLRWNC